MTRKKILLASFSRIAFAAYDNPGWKKNADGTLAADADGNPIYVNSAGQEQSQTANAISQRNDEAKQHRTAKEAAEAALAKYRTPDGKLIDPDLAVKSIDLASKIDAKTLIDAGKVDEVRQQVSAQYTGQIAERDTALAERDKRIADMSIDRVFDNSEFIRERVALPRDFFTKAIRDNFKFEDGKVKAYDRNGNPIYSKKNPGNEADAEEALELIVDQHAQKDMILRAEQKGGSGNNGGGGARGGGRTMRRSDFDALSPGEQAATAAAMAKGEATIVD